MCSSDSLTQYGHSLRAGQPIKEDTAEAPRISKCSMNSRLRVDDGVIVNLPDHQGKLFEPGFFFLTGVASETGVYWTPVSGRRWYLAGAGACWFCPGR